MLRASLRSTFFCAKSGVATSVAPRRESSTPSFKSASSRHFGSAAKQVYLLAVARGKHLDQHPVRWVTGECVPRLENCLVDGAEARSELHDGFRRQHLLLAVEQLLQNARGT